VLSPKRVKWRKQHRGNYKGFAQSGSEVSFGDFGLMCSSPGRISARQLEASRIAISRSVKRGGKLWIRIYPDRPVTKKAAETRMGSGKGNPEYWVAVVQPGRMLFEINGVSRQQAEEAFKLAAHKLPIRTRFVERS
jgi:large subunit ribosomal protein L16